MSSANKDNCCKEELSSEQLLKSIQNLTLSSSSNETEAGHDQILKTQEELTDLLSKLGSARRESHKNLKNVRKAAWKENARKEVSERTQFQNWLNTSILSTDDWSPILKKVTDPKDKFTLSNMSMMWNDLLKTKKTSYLFHLVFPIFHLRSYLTPNAIFNCRLICKEWKSCVDDHLQNLILPVDTAPGEPTPDTRSFHLWFTGDSEQAAANNLFTLEEYSGPNPLISRSVLIAHFTLTRGTQFDDDDIDQELVHEDCAMLHETERFFRRWGSEIWTLSLALRWQMEFEAFYSQLIRFTNMTPNLRKLDVGSNRFWVHMMGNPNTGNQQVGIDLDVRGNLAAEQLLERVFQARPLPELPKLEMLAPAYIPIPLVRRMMTKYGKTLKCLKIFDMKGDVGSYVDGMSFPKLEMFHFNCYTFDVDHFGYNVEWPELKEIVLFYFNIKGSSVPTLMENLSNLKNLKGLKTIILRLDRNLGPARERKIPEEMMKKLKLDLPQVADLELYVSKVNLKNIDFILPMVSLKKLYLSYEKTVKKFENDKKMKKQIEKEVKVKEENGASSASNLSSGLELPAKISSDEIIQLTEFTNNMYDSNIWNLFPELKKVTIVITSRLKGCPSEKIVKTKVYSRDGYNLHKKKKCEI